MNPKHLPLVALGLLAVICLAAGQAHTTPTPRSKVNYAATSSVSGPQFHTVGKPAMLMDAPQFLDPWSDDVRYVQHRLNNHASGDGHHYRDVGRLYGPHGRFTDWRTYRTAGGVDLVAGQPVRNYVRLRRAHGPLPIARWWFFGRFR